MYGATVRGGAKSFSDIEMRLRVTCDDLDDDVTWHFRLCPESCHERAASGAVEALLARRDHLSERAIAWEERCPWRALPHPHSERDDNVMIHKNKCKFRKRRARRRD